MERLSSKEELKQLRDKIQEEIAIRQQKIQVKVHLGTCGISAGADEVFDAFTREVESRNLSDILISKASCLGLCSREPTVTIISPNDSKMIYGDLTVDRVPKVVEEHLMRGNAIQEWALDQQSPFFTLQERLVLANQDIDPDSIDEYIARDGYRALAKVLTDMSAVGVIEEVKKSGLRGRGGAGFPAGLKWDFVHSAPGEEKYMVCNCDEGEPAVYKDRALLESSPHALIEGMAIGAFAMGAQRGYVYIQFEYLLGAVTLRHALEQAREYGLLGENILGTGFDFDIDIYLGGGHYICGEETALLDSLEGKRGIPRLRPPFPAQKGLFEKPTAVNNVETLVNIPLIILRGADWFSSIGTEKSKGSKLFCLGGEVNNVGLIEVPLGITLRQIVFDIGGGIPGGKQFKAALIGGPTGGCVPQEHLDMPIDYDSLTALGGIMGSGGLVIVNEDTCMVDIARFLIEFTKEESCGQCIPCRAGVPKMLQLISKVTEGNGTAEDLALLEELSDMISSSAFCALGQAAPSPIASTLRHFPEEYNAHITDRRCPAGVCWQ